MLDPKLAGCKWKLLGMVALIFASGVVTGAFTMNVAEHYWFHRQNALLSQAEKEMALQHFTQELHLNAEQARAIEEILDEFIMQEANLMSQFRSSRITGHDRILRVLNEDQRKRFQRVLDELNNKRKD